MRVTLNLATRPFADLGPAIKRLRIAMGVLAFLSILLGFGLHAIHQKAEAARANAHSLDGKIAYIAQEEEGYKALMKQPANAELLQQAAVLNKLSKMQHQRLTRATEAFDAVIARHGRALHAAKIVTEGLVHAIAEEIAVQRSAGATYGPRGTKTKPATAASVTLNQRA